jgi:hypothetical protein
MALQKLGKRVIKLIIQNRINIQRKHARYILTLQLFDCLIIMITNIFIFIFILININSFGNGIIIMVYSLSRGNIFCTSCINNIIIIIIIILILIFTKVNSRCSSRRRRRRRNSFTTGYYPWLLPLTMTSPGKYWLEPSAQRKVQSMLSQMVV